MTSDHSRGAAPSDYRPSFATNTMWTWTSVAINLATAFVVPPMLIRRLGDDAYGIWALVFSAVEYYTLLDFGVRSAVVKYVAQHWALGEQERLNRTINTAFWYLGAVGALLVVATLVVAPVSPSIFDIPPRMRGTFVYMMLVVGVTWGLAIVFQCFSSCLEAVQRFDLSNRILITANVVRTASILLLLLGGYGLAAVATAAAGARLVQCVLLWRVFSRRFPTFRWSFRAIDADTFRTLIRFGVHTVPGTLGGLLLVQGPALVIGSHLPERFVGYYALPWRLLYAALDLVYRIALVTNARVSELVARHEWPAIVKLGIQSNRYSLLLFVPAAAFLGSYGDALFAVWLTPQFAAISAPLLLIFLVSTLFADAAQSSSSSMLYALAKHQVVSLALLVESVLSIAFLTYFVARHDLTRAAIACAIVAVLNRGFLTPYLLCQQLGYPAMRYISAILTRPLVAGAAIAGVLWACRQTWLPGRNTLELGVAAALCVALFAPLAGRLVVLPADRAFLLSLIGERAPWLQRPARLLLGRPSVDAPSRN